MKKILGIFTAIAAVGAIATTTNTNTVMAGPNGGYGMAGCGLGSMVITGNSPMSQILAATTNASFFAQTFGITFGTSNCTGGGSPVINVNAFIQTNREVIAKDISRGQGETIKTLASMGGCPDSRAVGLSLQSRFGDIFPSSTVSDKQVSSRVVQLLQADASLQCKKLI